MDITLPTLEQAGGAFLPGLLGIEFGGVVNLPDGATGFTTIELKTNFLRTAQEEGRPMALFRCTQLILR